MYKFLIFGILLISIIGCNSPGRINEAAILSASILPQKYFIERITGDTYEINILIPPGASPASYEPVPQQIAELEESVAYFRIGHIGFEHSWMDKISSVSPDMLLVDLSEDIELISGADFTHGDHIHQGGIDPHIWLSPRRVKIINDNIYKAMIQIDPDHKEAYHENYLLFNDVLDSLDHKIHMMLSEYQGRSFLIFHPALTYLAADYGIEQIAIEWEGKEPSPGHLMELIDLGKKENIKGILVQEQFDMDNAKAIAEELGGKVIPINPLEEDWETSVIRIVNALVESFQITGNQ